METCNSTSWLADFASNPSSKEHQNLGICADGTGEPQLQKTAALSIGKPQSPRCSRVWQKEATGSIVGVAVESVGPGPHYLKMLNNPGAPSIQTIPTLGPKVYKYDLPWAGNQLRNQSELCRGLYYAWLFR